MIDSISRMLNAIDDESIIASFELSASEHLRKSIRSKVKVMDSEKLIKLSQYIKLLEEEPEEPEEPQELKEQHEEVEEEPQGELEEPEMSEEDRAELNKVLCEMNPEDCYSEPDSNYDSECDTEPYDCYRPEDEV
jgi:hypothetical protein